jgi:hypothetical protein
MSQLETHLNRLISLFESWGCDLSWSKILIVEDSSITRAPITFIPQAALHTPEQYTNKFDDLINGGYTWINMTAAGIVEDALLVVIELPSYTNKQAGNRVSVNLSGPGIKGGKPQWDISDTVKFIS